MTQRETREALNPALLAAGCRQDVLIWRQTVGCFRAMNNPNRIVSVGEAGQSDLFAIVATTITPDMVGKTIGVAVAAECKTKTGRQRDEQKNYELAVRKRGGIYRIIRSGEDMTKLIDDVQHGRW